MGDEHQTYSIIATTICECRKGHPDGGIGPEEAKQMAKCIVEALFDAVLQIVGPIGTGPEAKTPAGD